VILLDTNVWSALNRPAQHPQVCEWISGHVPKIWLSTIVIAEIRAGIENPDAAARRADLERWLTDIELAYAERTLNFASDAAHIFGTLVARRKLERQDAKLLDIQIAAQGLANDCPVATRNVRDFEWTGVRVINPWES
jgi:toxin FitB